MRCGPQCPSDHDTGLWSAATRVLGHKRVELDLGGTWVAALRLGPWAA